ncbi:hypothetical protein ACQ3G6_16515 [Allorhizobium undicola]|uniref:hypothetical protein n=1 Tax=Allorhizobium undicola TaxID=78527 RepID=UPI000483CCB9|nr:hypothetical protein [Allorhizobium undicola]
MTDNSDADKAPSPAELRRQRAAQKLRENLMRRKTQARARRAGEADDTTGLPAAKLPDAEV